jgi:hypothetical protein
MCLLFVQVVSKLRRRLLSDPGTLFNNDLAAFQDFVMLAAREVAVGETQVGSIFIDRCVSLAAAIAVELFPDLIKVHADVLILSSCLFCADTIPQWCLLCRVPFV